MAATPASNYTEDSIKSLELEERIKTREKESVPIVDKLFEYWKKNIKSLSKNSSTLKAINYAFNREEKLRVFLRDPKVQIDNNIAERAIRPIAIGRKNWLFAGSDRGGETAANFFTIIQTAKFNNINPQKYLAKLLNTVQDHKANMLHELLPWNIKL